MDSFLEANLRQLIMTRLQERALQTGGIIHRQELSRFDLGDGRTQRLVDESKGIWNPKEFSATLSIVSTPGGPYGDEEIRDGVLRYKYRSGSTAGDNIKLRAAIEQHAPIILFRKPQPNLLIPIFPVFAVADDTVRQEFTVLIDESLSLIGDLQNPTEAQRRYAQRVMQQRLHQPEFRARVIHAYKIRCAVCSLRHGDLLDAAHIIEDSHELGHPETSNGLSLCKLHHAAFDRQLLGIDPSHKVHINRGLLEETDGPMLRHGLQEMHGREIEIPERRKDRPDGDRLLLRWERYLAAS